MKIICKCGRPLIAEDHGMCPACRNDRSALIKRISFVSITVFLIGVVVFCVAKLLF